MMHTTITNSYSFGNHVINPRKRVYFIGVTMNLYEYRMTNQEYNYRVAVISDAIKELEEELQAFKDELKILKETQCTQDNTQDNQ